MQSAKPKIKFNLEGTTTSALMDRKVKSANVAYQRSYLEQLFYSAAYDLRKSFRVLVWAAKTDRFGISGHINSNKSLN
ncbi:MAG: hypothetical protein IPF70_13015 [Saprospiraceae bacterium]|nr:hypothetical protein [Saprospiraceae bacterium]